MKSFSSLDRILAPGGLLQSYTERYEDRPQQREMAEEVFEALRFGKHLVVEAGTGTGKTLAYLVPAALCGRRVVVSTATRALQEQIFLKDIPLLLQVLGNSFRASYLKGRSNYLCLNRFFRFTKQPLFAFREDARFYERVVEWANQTNTGDISDLRDVPEDWSVWKDIVSSKDSCLGQKCEHFDDCFVAGARNAAANSDIVVVNHHLFFADAALKAGPAGEFSRAAVIPYYDSVIFDEAHVIEDVATTFFGLCLSNYKVRDLCRDAERAAAEDKTLCDTLREYSARLFERGERLFLALHLKDGRQRLDDHCIAGASNEVSSLQEALDLVAATAGLAHDNEELIGIERRARELRTIVEEILLADAPGRVRWSDVRREGSFLHSSPVNAAEDLNKHIFSQIDSCVFTSATLSSCGSLDYFKERIGLCKDGEELYELKASIHPSPFDFQRQVALYVPLSMPEPSDPSFSFSVAQEVKRLCDISGGRAFVLCTSHRNMDAVFNCLKDQMALPVLKQGQAPKSALLDKFKTRPSILVATQTFWEGVDVPGEALSLVVVDKLPFSPPNDPVLRARIDLLNSAGRKAFEDLQIPQAALALKQGFGRLIRTKHDRGIVAVCDTRLAEKWYRRHFLTTLPPCPRIRNLEELAKWWHASLK